MNYVLSAMTLSKQQSQMIKGVAIIMVILSHVHRICDMPQTVEKLLNPCGYLGVALFLFVSGYGCMRSTNSNDMTTLWKRIKRVALPLALATIISYLALVISGDCLPLGVVCLQAIGIYNGMCSACWYITFQYVCYLAFMLLGEKASFHCTIIWGSAFSIFVLFLSIVIDIDGLFINLWGLNSFSFVAGVIMAHCSLKKIFSAEIGVIALSLIFVTLFICVYFLLGNPEDYKLRNPLKSLVALSFVLIFFFFANKPFHIERVMPVGFRWMGGGILLAGHYSYYIYLSHVLWVFCFNEIAYDTSLIVAIIKLSVVTILGTLIIKQFKDISYRLLMC